MESNYFAAGYIEFINMRKSFFLLCDILKVEHVNQNMVKTNKTPPSSFYRTEA